MYNTASLPDGQLEVKSPLVLGDNSAETEPESVSTPQITLGQQVPVSLSSTGIIL